MKQSQIYLKMPPQVQIKFPPLRQAEQAPPPSRQQAKHSHCPGGCFAPKNEFKNNFKKK